MREYRVEQIMKYHDRYDIRKFGWRLKRRVRILMKQLLRNDYRINKRKEVI